MCGHDLREQPKRKQRVSLVDVVLVLAVLAVLVFWWRIGAQPQPGAEDGSAAAAILPTNIPRMTPSVTPEPTVEPSPTPVPPTPENLNITHEVKSGETLLAIASIYGITVNELQAANGLSDVLIRIGDELIIPVERLQEAAAPATDAAGFEYNVNQGDTVISIAVQFGSTVQSILEANNLSESSLLMPGDVLVVPVPDAPVDTVENSPAEGGGDSTSSFEFEPSDTIYIEPRLIGPPDGATISREQSVLLRWISVDILEPNEWYVLLVYPKSGTAQTLPSIWTKSTSYRMLQGQAPAEGESAGYAWQVSVVRVEPGEGGRRILEAASPSSEIREFTWK